MKRRIVFILLLLVAGAIVNVAVAWTHVYQLRIERDADIQQAPSTMNRWLFAEFGLHGWPRATLEGIDGFHIICPGFAINTVFYAFILWLLFAAPFALRRRLRAKRGLCVKCAYDLRGRSPDGAVCPECESPIPTKEKVH